MATTERLTIELPSHLVKGLRESVKSGAYSSESEAIEMLLQSWYSSEGVEEPDPKTLRALVAEGIADVDAGRVYDADEIHAELRARIKEIAGRTK